MTKKRPNPTDEVAEAEAERDFLIKSLRRNGQLIDADSEDVPLPPGVTHVLVRERGKVGPRLVERRKSFI